MAWRVARRTATVAVAASTNRYGRREVEWHGRGRWAGAVVAHHSGRGAQTGGSDRGAARPAATISESESGERLYWDGAKSAGLRGDRAAWSHHASRKSAGAFPASRSS